MRAKGSPLSFCVVVAVSAAVAHAQAPKWADKSRATGTIVSVTPDPYTALKSFVVKTASKNKNKDQMDFAVAEGVRVPKGLKAGDIVSIQYRVDQSGIMWADSVTKTGVAKPPPPAPAAH